MQEEEELTAANEYGISSIFEAAITKLNKINSEARNEKKQIIMDLAKELEGKIPLETISTEIVHQLHGRVSERFIHESLDEKYKQKFRIENARRQNKKEKKEMQRKVSGGSAAKRRIHKEKRRNYD